MRFTGKQHGFKRVDCLPSAAHRLHRQSRAFILALLAAEDPSHQRREVSHAAARGTILRGEGIILPREVAIGPRGASILRDGVKILPRGGAILSRGAMIGPHGHAIASRGRTILLRGLAILLHDEKIVPHGLAIGPRDSTIELHDATILGTFATNASLQTAKSQSFAKLASSVGGELGRMPNAQSGDIGADRNKTCGTSRATRYGVTDRKAAESL